VHCAIWRYTACLASLVSMCSCWGRICLQASRKRLCSVKNTWDHHTTSCLSVHVYMHMLRLAVCYNNYPAQAAEALRGPAYLLPLEEVASRVAEATARGATEVSMVVSEGATVMSNTQYTCILCLLAFGLKPCAQVAYLHTPEHVHACDVQMAATHGHLHMPSGVHARRHPSRLHR
jgi:deoxyribose-phosphate aldolase